MSKATKRWTRAGALALTVVAVLLSVATPASARDDNPEITFESTCGQVLVSSSTSASIGIWRNDDANVISVEGADFQPVAIGGFPGDVIHVFDGYEDNDYTVPEIAGCDYSVSTEWFVNCNGSISLNLYVNADEAFLAEHSFYLYYAGGSHWFEDPDGSSATVFPTTNEPAYLVDMNSVGTTTIWSVLNFVLPVECGADTIEVEFTDVCGATQLDLLSHSQAEQRYAIVKNGDTLLVEVITNADSDDYEYPAGNGDEFEVFLLEPIPDATEEPFDNLVLLGSHTHADACLPTTGSSLPKTLGIVGGALVLLGVGVFLALRLRRRPTAPQA